MLDKLKEIERKYSILEERLQQPEVYADPALFRTLSKEQKDLAPLVDAYREYRKRLADREEALSLLGDPDLKDLAREEVDRAAADISRLEEKLRVLLLPKDPNDGKNVIVEIRGGAGGEEVPNLHGSSGSRAKKRPSA